MHVDTPLEVCLLRNARRADARRVPEEVLRRMAAALERPADDGFGRCVTVLGETDVATAACAPDSCLPHAVR